MLKFAPCGSAGGVCVSEVIDRWPEQLPPLAWDTVVLPLALTFLGICLVAGLVHWIADAIVESIFRLNDKKHNQARSSLKKFVMFGKNRVELAEQRLSASYNQYHLIDAEGEPTKHLTI